MYPQHEKAIQNLIEKFKNDLEVLAVILGGSIAKGLERPDSDVDAIVVVTPERYERQRDERRITECVFEGCDYPGGYFDLKYYTKEYLEAAADHGSEPTRYAYMHARCLFTRDPKIEDIVARLGVFQKQEREEKMKSFYAAVRLYSGYFWQSGCKTGNTYLKVRSASATVLYGLRMILQEAEVLFPCQKNLMQAVRDLPEEKKPAQIVELAEEFLNTMDSKVEEKFVKTIRDFIKYRPDGDYYSVVSRFIEDQEEWWHRERPYIEEW